MKLTRRKTIKIALYFVLFFYLLSLPNRAFAATLIQGMNHQDEYEGMLDFDLLENSILEKPDIDEVVEMVVPSTVRLVVNEYLGSGTIVNMQKNRIIIASSSHLLLFANEVEVTFYDGTILEGNIIGNSEQFDVGFVEVLLEDIPYPLMINMRFAPLNHEAWGNITFGSDVCLVGSADGVGANRENGTVLDPWLFFPEFNSFMIKSYCEGKPGLSGCGTFDNYGNYIGLLTGGLENEIASLPLPIVLEQYEIIVGEYQEK